MFKANDGPPVESAMAARHSNLSSHLKQEVHQHVKLTGGSNPAPYIHSTGQTYTEQDQTNHKLKAGSRQKSISKIQTSHIQTQPNQQTLKRNSKHYRKVQPLKATLLVDHTQQQAKQKTTSIRRHQIRLPSKLHSPVSDKSQH